ncbi:MAG: metallophosphoesterase [Phycisphaerae bacterium]|nr:metallophosphoesterase [Phycisphaerae bacterium]
MPRTIGCLAICLGLLTPLTPTLARDVTLFVTADTHYGDALAGPYNPVQIQALNGLPGWPYPDALGTVDTPRGVIVAGDLTDEGLQEQWEEFVTNYGLTGADGLLDYPVFEGRGNHDKRNGGLPVKNGVISRHGSLTYSWDWDDVHIVCLDVIVTPSVCSWLIADLATVPPHRPVILWHHYGFDSYSLDAWTDEELDAYEDAIRGHNVVAIFNGHNHLSSQYTWRGCDVYSPGAPALPVLAQSFAVVRLTDDQMLVAEYEWTAGGGAWTGGSWAWSHTKPLNPPGLVSLSISAVNCQVTLDPPPVDPNQPRYPVDTEVTLHAVPNSFMSFVHWLVYDPNYPGDNNAPPALIDANTSITVALDNDLYVEAVCKCGATPASLPLPLLATLCALPLLRPKQ